MSLDKMYQAGRKRGVIAEQLQAATDAIRLGSTAIIHGRKQQLAYQRGYLDGFREGMYGGQHAAMGGEGPSTAWMGRGGPDEKK